jgi:predicted alpha-1,6-mannanase (GH76 family)
MVRTQIYLTDRQRDELASLAKASGKKQSELIREAIDQLIVRASPRYREAVLGEAAGIWENRNDLQGFEVIRGAWDRS